ncbi:MAG: DUF87 domain-containing protein, partial [Eggerthellaceae bacterium]|nr:DUF87 domain-containing protein [Eggerthellaceae bacterium]
PTNDAQDDALIRPVDREEEASSTVLLKREKAGQEDEDEDFQDAATVIIDPGSEVDLVEPDVLSEEESANLKAKEKQRKEAENLVVDDILDEPDIHEKKDNLRGVKDIKIDTEKPVKESFGPSMANCQNDMNFAYDTLKDVADIEAIKPEAAPAVFGVDKVAKGIKYKAGFSAKTNEGKVFILPDLSILKKSKKEKKTSIKEFKQTAIKLENTIQEFGIAARVVNWIAGPTVTLFSVDIPAGCRVNKITNLADDISLALASPGVRIFAPVPGTNYVGIEVTNKNRETVCLGDILPYIQDKEPLEIAIGKDVEGNHVISDLSKMPHLLIGGTTGSGKSVSINAMIMSIIMRATPDQVRMILIDPKHVEFSLYDGIPHLYVPVVTEPKEAASSLSWAVAEMERRLKVFKKEKVRNIKQYNRRVEDGLITEDASLEGAVEDISEGKAKKLPYIVIIIDELADLMMNAGREVEFFISRIAAVARAAGIHLIIATQRPSANVVTGLIKSNITNRIAFNVASSIDSRVILDSPGAECLIGLGDMLFSKTEIAKPIRIQGCFVSEPEINKVVKHLNTQASPDYHDEILKTALINIGGSKDGAGFSVGTPGSDEELLWEAAEVVCLSGVGSTSAIQRRLKLGYARAGRIMDMLEEKGIVGPPQGSKPREVLLDEHELEGLKAIDEHMGED